MDKFAIANKYPKDRLITTNHTLELSDAGKVIRANSAGDITITVPNTSTADFPIGTEIGIIRYNTGEVIIDSAGGVTVHSRNGFKRIDIRYGSVALRHVAENFWVLNGALKPEPE